jgi:hypothetical protein
LYKVGFLKICVGVGAQIPRRLKGIVVVVVVVVVVAYERTSHPSILKICLVIGLWLFYYKCAWIE